MKNKLPSRLKELREEKGLSITELAKALNISHTAISRWERAKRIPNAEMIFILCEFFCCEASYLLGLID